MNQIAKTQIKNKQKKNKTTINNKKSVRPINSVKKGVNNKTKIKKRC